VPVGPVRGVILKLHQPIVVIMVVDSAMRAVMTSGLTCTMRSPTAQKISIMTPIGD